MAKKMQTSINFVWDLDKLEIADGIKFTDGTDQLTNYLMDSTISLIQEAMKDDRIFELINIAEVKILNT
jgi:hypothetical protein